MIQRIQTLYMLLAVVLCVTCLCLPLGYYVTDTGVRVATLNNLWFAYSPGLIVEGMTGRTLRPWALFALLVIVSTLTVMNIFMFKRRALQMRLCSFCMILLGGWYVLYAYFIYILGHGLEAHFRPDWEGALPFAALVLLYLAFRGVMRDEMLVRSLDRLR